MAWKEEIIMELHILQVGDVLVSPDIFTEKFCCDLDACKGACCIEGDAGAPVTMDETLAIEDVLDTVWPSLSAQAQSVIDRGGVAYTDEEGDLVTSIVGGKDCVFTCYDKDSCLCALEKPIGPGRPSLSSPSPAPFTPSERSSLLPISMGSTITVGRFVHRAERRERNWVFLCTASSKVPSPVALARRGMRNCAV